MKLHELEKGDLFRLAWYSDSPIFTFEKVDGAYSRCFTVSGDLIHLAAYADVEKEEKVQQLATRVEEEE
jgi:hypothetical protein